jgi:hypothetical protein
MKDYFDFFPCLFFYKASPFAWLDGLLKRRVLLGGRTLGRHFDRC